MAKSNTSKCVCLVLIAILIIGGSIFSYFYFYFPFSDSGVKAGVLNNMKHKGVVFKTYEGELIQIGFENDRNQDTIQSNEFQFSVESKELAQKLMELSGQLVKLHYKEYYHALPWRGYSKFVVDSILESLPFQNEPIQLPLETDSLPATKNEESVEELPLGVSA